MSGPCDWPINYAACETPEPDPEEVPGEVDEMREAAEKMAVDFLWNWTGQRFGTCTTTLRPCRTNCDESRPSTFDGRGPGRSGSAGVWRPVLINGEWFNLSCGHCGGTCSCDRVSSLVLPGPVVSIEEVQINGEVLPPTAYRLRGNCLIRTDGGDWPTCQDFTADLGEPNTWGVTYTLGVEVPMGGQIAAGILAREFELAMCNSSKCALPRRLQSLTRQGVTMAVLDTFEDIDSGHTGIWLIDSWIASVTQPRRQSRVASPDMPRYRRRR